VSITHEQYEALVRRLEQTAQKSPGAYRLRVVAWAALAYAYVAGVLLLAVGLVAALVAALVMAGRTNAGLLKLVAKGGWALGALAVAIVRALWVRLDPPQGIDLAPADHPELFATIERVRRHLRAPRAHRVLLTDDFNAAVVQLPRLGVLGWQHNTLKLGLPLLQALSRRQFEAVLAHEYGHLSGSHGRLGAWIYRSSVTIGRLYEKMESERHWASFVFLPFFRWFWPRFSATSFVQRRAQEYAADRGGAEIAGARQMADALLALELRGAHLEAGYWEGVTRRADEVAQPDVGPFSEMGPRAFAAMREEDARRWLEQALAQPTGVDDSHPGLRDRLAALGEAPRIPPPLLESAGHALLGGALPALAARLDAVWREQVAESWRQRFEQVRDARERMAQLDKAAAAGELSDAEQLERAELVEEQRGAGEALPLYRSLLSRRPDDPIVHFAVGRILAGQDDAACLEHLDAAIAAHPDAVIPGCQHAYGFLMRAGRAEQAEGYASRARRHHQMMEEARDERSELRLDGRYEHHGLGAAQLEPLLGFLRGQPEVKKVWLVRRQLVHFPDQPLFALGVRRRRGGLRELLSVAARKQLDLELQQKLREAPLPGEAFILVLNHRGRRERALFERVAGSQLLPA
jgi:Zn-dependent protease with chaperone function